ASLRELPQAVQTVAYVAPIQHQPASRKMIPIGSRGRTTNAIRITISRCQMLLSGSSSKIHSPNSAPPKTAVPHLLSPGSARVVPLRSRRDRLRRTTVPPVPRLPLLHGGIERRKAADQELRENEVRRV